MVRGQKKARVVEVVLYKKPIRQVPNRRVRKLDLLPSTLSLREINSYITAKSGGVIKRIGFITILYGIVRVEEKEYNRGYSPI